MRIRPEHAYAVLSRVDPERLRLGWRVGLRDAALLALVAAGLSPDEIAALNASAITMNGGQVFVAVPRDIPSRWFIVLDKPLVPPVLDWLEACRLWASTEHLFQHGRGPITAIGVRKVLLRYGSRRTPQRPGRRRRR